MTGRKNKPRINGTTDVRTPAAPVELTGDASAEWRRMARKLFHAGIATELDRGIMIAYCQAFGRWAQAERSVAEMAKRDAVTFGLLVKTTNGNAIQNPLVGVANKALSDMARYAAELGMTPTARVRLTGGTEDLGKKGERDAAAAEEASDGAFAVPAGPRLVVRNR